MRKNARFLNATELTLNRAYKKSSTITCNRGKPFFFEVQLEHLQLGLRRKRLKIKMVQLKIQLRELEQLELEPVLKLEQLEQLELELERDLKLELEQMELELDYLQQGRDVMFSLKAAQAQLKLVTKELKRKLKRKAECKEKA